MKTLFFLLISFSYPLFGQQILSEWETSRKSETVELQYRWVQFGDTLKTRELCSIFNLDAPSDAIINNLCTASNFKYWSVGIEDCKTLEKTNDSWVMYSLFNIPKPFTQQDLIAKYIIEREGIRTIIKIEALPEYLPQKKGVARMRNYTGYWILQENGNNSTDVRFYSTVYTKPVFPRFIQDPILQRMLIKSFEKLIKLSYNEATTKI